VIEGWFLIIAGVCVEGPRMGRLKYPLTQRERHLQDEVAHTRNKYSERQHEVFSAAVLGLDRVKPWQQSWGCGGRSPVSATQADAQLSP
jgi:hypothetical protein